MGAAGAAGRRGQGLSLGRRADRVPSATLSVFLLGTMGSLRLPTVPENRLWQRLLVCFPSHS